MSYTLDQIVREYIIENGGSQMNTYSRLYTIAVSGLRDLAMDVSSVPKSIELTINDNDTVDLPLGFLNYISVSIVGRDGYLWGLGRNDRINLTKYYNDCGVPTNPPVNANYALGDRDGYLSNPTYIATHYRNGENFGGYFNAGGHNTVGAYKFDYNTNQIILSGLGQDCDTIILEYISDIQSEDNDFIIHPFLVEAIKNWIYFKNIQRDRNFSLGEKQLAEQSYVKARRMAVRRFNANTMGEWLDAFRKTNSAIPRW